jgi:hypothetical protein
MATDLMVMMEDRPGALAELGTALATHTSTSAAAAR